MNMNLQTWAKWVAEIDAMSGGAIVELRPGPYGGMKIGVRWMIGNERYGYEHAMSLGEMDRMVEAAQPCVLEQITHAVRRMTPNDRVEGRDAASSRRVPSHDGLAGD
jgi:hypothetical protein